jgi:membrane-bound lytic murein transglycosylase D
MTFAARHSLLALLALACLYLAGCSSTSVHKVTAEMPVPPEIEPNVDFWRMVYAEWSRSQVAFHDDEYLDVIYEVARLPGPVRGGYTAEQNRFVKARKAEYRDRLASLERKLSSGRGLTRSERELREKLVDAGGRSAVYGASDRVRAQRGVRERFRRGLEISGRYDDAFRTIFRARGLPEDLAYLPHVESSFQLNARSSVGAAGVWQFMPATGRLYDLTVNHAIDERLDPILAAEGAARYLGDAHRKLGSWPLAITSYNHGQGGMAKAKGLYGDDIGRIVRHYKGRYFGFSSRNFYASFLAAREVAGNPEQYFQRIVYEKPLDHDRLVLRHSVPARRLASHYGVSVYRLSDMNLAWRRAVLDRGAKIPSGSTIWLPAGTTRRVASQPAPEPVLVARVEPKPAPKVAAAAAKPAPRPAAAVVKTHVVKPNETLYRVALRYDMSVDELKRLNRIKDDTIRAGQRLRVGGSS